MCKKVFKGIGNVFKGLIGIPPSMPDTPALPSPNAGQAQADAARRAALNNDGKDDLDVTGGGKSMTLGGASTRKRRLS